MSSQGVHCLCIDDHYRDLRSNGCALPKSSYHFNDSWLCKEINLRFVDKLRSYMFNVVAPWAYRKQATSMGLLCSMGSRMGTSQLGHLRALAAPLLDRSARRPEDQSEGRRMAEHDCAPTSAG